MTSPTEHQHMLWWSRAAAGLLLLALFLAPILAGNFLVMPASLIRLLIFLSAGLLVTYFYVTKEYSLFKTPLNLPVLIYLALAFLSIFWSYGKYRTLMAFFELFSEVLAGFLIVHLVISRRRLNWLVLILGLVAGIVCFMGIQEYFQNATAEWRNLVASGLADRGFMGFLKTQFTNPPDWRIYGPFYNPNIFADFLIIVLPITLSSYLLVERRDEAMVFGFLLFMEFCALMLTASKGAWGALIVSMLIYVILAFVGRAHIGPKPVHRLVTLGIVLLAAGVVLIQPMVNRVEAATTTEAHSGIFRMYLWKSTVHLIKAHPFGTGLGTFEIAYPQFAIVGHTQTVHNNYLQIAAESGVLSLLVILWILVILVKTVISSLAESRKKAPSRHTAVPLLLIGFATAVCASALHSLVDYAWYVPATGLLFWVCIAMTLVTSGVPQPTKQKSFGIVGWGLFSLVLLALIFASTRTGLAALAGDNSQEFALKGNYQAALDQAEDAVDLDSWNPENHNRLAQLFPQQGMIDRALEENQLTIQAEPTDPRFQMMRASLLVSKKDLNGAKEASIKAAELEPKSTECWKRLAEIEMRIGEPAKALDAWRQIIKIQKSPAGLYPAIPELVDTNPVRADAALAFFEIHRKNWNEALQYLQDAERIMVDYQAFKKRIIYEAMTQNGEIDPQEEKAMDNLRINLLLEQSQVYQTLNNKQMAEKTRQQAESLRSKLETAQ